MDRNKKFIQTREQEIAKKLNETLRWLDNEQIKQEVFNKVFAKYIPSIKEIEQKVIENITDSVVDQIKNRVEELSKDILDDLLTDKVEDIVDKKVRNISFRIDDDY